MGESSRPTTQGASSFTPEANEAGLRRSRLKELRQQDETNEARLAALTTTNRKHSSFGLQPVRKAIQLTALLSSVSDYNILNHAPPPDALCLLNKAGLE